MALDQLVIEGFQLKPLRKVLEDKGAKVESSWASLRVLGAILVAVGLTEDQAKTTLMPLSRLHGLRSTLRAQLDRREGQGGKARAVHTRDAARSLQVVGWRVRYGFRRRPAGTRYGRSQSLNLGECQPGSEHGAHFVSPRTRRSADFVRQFPSGKGRCPDRCGLVLRRRRMVPCVVSHDRYHTVQDVREPAEVNRVGLLVDDLTRKRCLAEVLGVVEFRQVEVARWSVGSGGR